MATLREQLIADMRAVADFFEAHPDLPVPGKLELDVYGVSKEQLRAVARAFPRVEKGASDIVFWLRCRFSYHTRLDFNGIREEICERVEVGTRLVAEQIVPAKEAQVIPAHEEPIVEWRCGSILKDGAQ